MNPALEIYPSSSTHVATWFPGIVVPLPALVYEVERKLNSDGT